MAKEVKVEPYSMAFVTAPNKDVAKKLAGGLGKLPTYILPIRGDNSELSLGFQIRKCYQ